MTQRGRLKIFLGYAAGVGKTYAMLEAARRKKFDEHIDVVIGIAVSHGRKETEKLLEDMEALPLLSINYRGALLSELDLDLVLERKPQLVVVDELAHTNPPGLRHPKRYMDIEELLRTGIDVYTTLNIQHIESYQDAIEEATGIQVRERIPDKFLDEADEIELIDLPPEELLERLKQGKVYIPEQAKRAIASFFKKDTLQLLREMALRKTAAIVDIGRNVPSQIGSPGKNYNLSQGKVQLLPKLLASIGPSPFSERVIRATKRLADMLRAEWFAVSVETPEIALSIRDKDLKQIEKHLQLAEELGAVTMKLSGNSVSEALYSFSMAHGITQIVIGHSLRPWYERIFRKSPVDELVSKDHAIDVYVISSTGGIISKNVGEGTSEKEVKPYESYHKRLKTGFATSLIKNVFNPFFVVLLFTFLLLPVSAYVSFPTIATLYLLSSTVAAALFDTIGFYIYLFWSLIFLELLYISDLETWLTRPEVAIFFMAVCIIGMIVNRLSVHRKKLTGVLRKRHDAIRDLYDLSRQLVQVTSTEEMVQMVDYHLSRLFDVNAIVALGSNSDIVMYGLQEAKKNALFDMSVTEKMAMKWAIDHHEPAGCTTETLPLAKACWFPLTVSGTTIGAMAIFSSSPQDHALEDILEGDMEGLEAYVHLMALSVDRIKTEGK